LDFIVSFQLAIGCVVSELLLISKQFPSCAFDGNSRLNLWRLMLTRDYCEKNDAVRTAESGCAMKYGIGYQLLLRLLSTKDPPGFVDRCFLKLTFSSPGARDLGARILSFVLATPTVRQ
jgi:hypothetical protein